MRTLFVLIALLTMSASVDAQLKTYSGPFKVGVNTANGDCINGKATYTYKEVDDERVKEGKFTFSADERSLPLSITGTFKDGRKTGHWKTVTQGEANSYQNMMYSLTPNCSATRVLVTNGVKTIMEGDYLGGLRTGKWTFSKTDLQTGTTYKSEASFKDGKFYGAYVATYHVAKMSGDIIYKDISVTGQFVAGGLPDSVWKAKWVTSEGIEFLAKLTFDEGKMVTYSVKDQSTGDYVVKEGDRTGNSFLDHNPHHATNIDGINPDTRAVYFPMPYQMMITGWFVDESLLTFDRNEMKLLFIDWE